MKITGEKIILREFRESDLQEMHSWVNDEEIIKNLTMSIFPRTLEDSKKFLELQLNRKSNEYVNFVIATKDEYENYIGTVGLRNIDYVNRNCELAITVGIKIHQNGGIGTEAVKLITNYAFETLNLHKVYLNCLDINKAARKVYEKCGFMKSGEFKEHIYKEGCYYNLIFMEILNR